MWKYDVYEFERHQQRFGRHSIYFKQGTDPDMAAVNVQNRVSMAQGLLPAEVTKIGVTTRKRQTSMLMVFSIYDEKTSTTSSSWKTTPTSTLSLR